MSPDGGWYLSENVYEQGVVSQLSELILIPAIRSSWSYAGSADGKGKGQA
ncbi:hypothetical protein [Candidatus Enterovibrio escicola]